MKRIPYAIFLLFVTFKGFSQCDSTATVSTLLETMDPLEIVDCGFYSECEVLTSSIANMAIDYYPSILLADGWSVSAILCAATSDWDTEFIGMELVYQAQQDGNVSSVVYDIVDSGFPYSFIGGLFTSNPETDHQILEGLKAYDPSALILESLLEYNYDGYLPGLETLIATDVFDGCTWATAFKNFYQNTGNPWNWSIFHLRSFGMSFGDIYCGGWPSDLFFSEAEFLTTLISEASWHSDVLSPKEMIADVLKAGFPLLVAKEIAHNFSGDYDILCPLLEAWRLHHHNHLGVTSFLSLGSNPDSFSVYNDLWGPLNVQNPCNPYSACEIARGYHDYLLTIPGFHQMDYAQYDVFIDHCGWTYNDIPCLLTASELAVDGGFRCQTASWLITESLNGNSNLSLSQTVFEILNAYEFEDLNCLDLIGDQNWPSSMCEFVNGVYMYDSTATGVSILLNPLNGSNNSWSYGNYSYYMDATVLRDCGVFDLCTIIEAVTQLEGYPQVDWIDEALENGTCSLCDADIDNDGVCDGEDDCVGTFDDCGVCMGDGTSCQGCTYTSAINYNSTATKDDGSCTFNLSDSCPGDFTGDGYIGVDDILTMLSLYDTSCSE